MGVLFDVAPVEAALARLLTHTYPSVDLTPTSRILNPIARAARSAELSVLVEDFDATISAVACIESKIARLLLELEQRRARIKTALAPVTALPVEILREIFLLATAKDARTNVSIAISHVSSHWRTVSIGLRRLWNNISHPGTLHEWAERSGDLPLHLRLSPWGRWPDGLEITPTEASRVSSWWLWPSLNVGKHACLGAPPSQFAASLLRYATLFPLEIVTIMGVADPSDDPSLLRTFNISKPEHDALASVCKARLSEVNLSGVPVFSCQLWLSLLSENSPLLSTLRLTSIFGHQELADYDDDDDDSEDIEEAITESYRIAPPECCDRLHSLLVKGCCEAVYTPILNIWVMPALVSLVLDLRPTPGQSVWSADQASLSDSLTTLFSHSPALEQLSLTCDYVTVDLPRVFIRKLSDAECPVPLLHTVRICCIGYITAFCHDKFVYAFESRTAAIPGYTPLRDLDVRGDRTDHGEITYYDFKFTLTKADGPNQLRMIHPTGESLPRSSGSDLS